MDDINLLDFKECVAELKDVGRHLVKFGTRRQGLLGSGSTEAITGLADINIELAALGERQIALSRRKQALDAKKVADRENDLDNRRDAAIVDCEELQSLMLPFAEALQAALEGVSDEWVHILELSDRVRLYNQLALNNRRPQICTGHLEPKTLRRTVMHQVRRSLGADTVIAPLPLLTIEDRASSLVQDFESVLKLEREVNHNG